MVVFRTWLLTGLAGALSATLWLGAFTKFAGGPSAWLLVGSVVTFALLVGVFTAKLRPSQLTHAIPAISVGYAIGWAAVQDATEDAFGGNRYLVGLLALALATVVSLVTARVVNRPADPETK